jgi:predicted nucleotide-binding protein (sugar kinase/HSP70/actin superfamily)
MVMETPAPKRHLPLMNKPAPSPLDADIDVDVEAAMREFERIERERLGIREARKQWVDNMVNPQVKRDEREGVTLLIGGLTKAQDFFAEGAFRGLGYNVIHLDAPDNLALQTGKEFGNRGQCNPTYFTVGNLVRYLITLREERGMSTEEILKKYVFFTAGACGPCRFGMYVTEYRKALRDAGFDGFRVMLFQQQGGLSQATGEEPGIDLTPEFFIAMIKGIVAGDVLNALGYRIRPYEVEPGATDRAIEASKKIIYEALYRRTNVLWALYQARKVMETVKVDRTRPRPKVSIIGEFWAMTTEGDGNYFLQKFLESEGCENDIQLTTAWILYNIWEIDRDTRERRELRADDADQRGLHEMKDFDVAKRLATLRLAEWGLRLGFQAFALPMGLYDYHLPDMNLVAEVARPYYSDDLRGGEGHMEVGKLILNTVMSKAHMTVSVKPFGCMPSSGVSDGVQSLITSRFPGTIFCAVETSGDGATNFYSRVQMYTFKARQVADAEYQKTLADCGVTDAQMKDFLAKNPKYGSPLHKPPHVKAGTAADLVLEVAPYLTKSRAERMRDRLTRAAATVRKAAEAAPGVVAKVVETVRDEDFRAQVTADVAVLRELASGKLQERVGPLVERLAGRAFFSKDVVTETPSARYDAVAASA